MSSTLWTLGFAPFATFGFMREALVACIALALAQGPIGALLLLRRQGLVGDLLSHAVMPGAALGFLAAGYSLAALSLGGLFTGLVVAGLAGLAQRLVPEGREASLAAFYLVALALGVMLVSYYGSNADLMHVLFGTVLAIDLQALLLIAAISSVSILVLATIYRPLAVDSFDPDFLRAIGAGGGRFRAIFLILVVLNLVASFQAMGTLLAVGPLLLPAAAARCWAHRVPTIIALAIAFGIAADYAGLLVSYHANLPSGPAIVLAGGAIYGVSLLVAGPLATMRRFVSRGSWAHSAVSKRN
jgi:zinc/manganese transport system permease protein